MDDRNEHFPFPRIQSTAAGSIVYPPGGRFGPRLQQDIQLVLLHTGQMEVSIDGELHKAQSGNVVILKPGHMEQFHFSKNKETWHRWIAVNLTPITDETYEHLQTLPFSLPISEDLNRLTDLILSLQSSYPRTSETMRSLGLSALHLYESEQSRIRQESIHPSVHRAKSLIQLNFHDDMSLEQLASDVGLSPEHLVRLFRKFEETTPMKYLWNCRVLRANEMLTQTGLSIGEIANRCGFKTSYHFARIIKQTTGRTPTEIRFQHWKGE
ncbi:helix-turn-helix domain-containing protein [Paenibacillus sp. GCM10027628]|uniref:AraC family transcriptional regulator n=1 Tax=Paenibacillus sp. GCM10027628 TaxID=3273413 RepID=UPI00362B2BC4